MSSRTGKGPVIRSYRRRKCEIDLNVPAPAVTENREQEGPSNQVRTREVAGQPLVLQPPLVAVAQQPQVAVAPQPLVAVAQQPLVAVAQQPLVVVAQQPQAVQPPTIDVEAIDDDVVESSPRAFAEAKNNSRRNRARDIVVDLESEDQTRVANNNRNKRRRQPSNQTVINCNLLINLEGSGDSMRENVKVLPEPPKEPVFSCPICMGPLVEEMSTRCGHIFCKACIRAAISAQNKCPTCRKKVTVKELIRVFLPSTN